MDLQEAMNWLHSGKVEFALAGGVDSYLDLHILGSLDRDKRVLSPARADGFIPGEGSAFLLLASPEAARTHDLTPRARLSAVAADHEDGHLYSEKPYRGDGLARTFTRVFSDGNGQVPIRNVYATMNGESHWAKEWGVAYLRNRKFFDPAFSLHHPADCYGDLGAAAGLTLAGLAVHGIAEEYRESPSLIFASNDRGERAAVIVSSA
jgi:3-oxoacyl-[acyl-carrier-protein] synthase-1